MSVEDTQEYTFTQEQLARVEQLVADIEEIKEGTARLRKRNSELLVEIQSLQTQVDRLKNQARREGRL